MVRGRGRVMYWVKTAFRSFANPMNGIRPPLSTGPQTQTTAATALIRLRIVTSIWIWYADCNVDLDLDGHVVVDSHFDSNSGAKFRTTVI